MDSATKYAIECRGITKTFGTVKANDGVNLQLKHGEILALLGENGSGKTTLMNMLSGIYHPDEGDIYIDGNKVSINSPIDSMNNGIGMIHQHFKLIDVYSAMDNIVLGVKEKKINPKELSEKIKAISEKYGLAIDPEKKIYNMSVSEKQTVEILKVLYRGAKILILDEPTAVLTPQESDQLFDILRKMREAGNAIIIITHKLDEVLSISDRVTVLRKGKTIDTVITKDVDVRKLTELMVGRPVDLMINRPQTEKREKLLQIKNLSVVRGDMTEALKNVSFDIDGGEILGVAGVAGSGQKELCEAIAGLVKIKEGSIIFKDTDIVGKSPAEIYDMQISLGFIPEDRLGMGLVSTMGITDNMLLKNYRRSKGWFLDRKPAKELAEYLVEKLEIDTPGIDHPVRMLSGGNVQKVLLGREIESNPEVLVTAYPVRGLDINSSYLVYDLLNKQKEKGSAILFVAEDLDVLLELSDRIVVMCHGEVTGIVDAESITKEEIGLMMAGIRREV